MIIPNDDGKIIHANSSASTLYGTKPHELLGQSLTRFLPDEMLLSLRSQPFMVIFPTVQMIVADAEHSLSLSPSIII